MGQGLPKLKGHMARRRPWHFIVKAVEVPPAARCLQIFTNCIACSKCFATIISWKLAVLSESVSTRVVMNLSRCKTRNVKPAATRSQPFQKSPERRVKKEKEKHLAMAGLDIMPNSLFCIGTRFLIFHKNPNQKSYNTS